MSYVVSRDKKDIRPVFVAYPAIYSLLMLNYLVYKTNIKFVGIILSNSDIKVKKKNLSLIESVLTLIKQSGLRYTLYMLFIAKFIPVFLVSWNTISMLIGKSLNLKTFGMIAKEQKVPLIKSKDINSKATVDFTEDVNANIIVSAYNNQILGYKTCKKFRHGGINIHNAYLPDFRGLDAAFEVLYHGVEETGVTLHCIDKGVDTGGIILQEKVAINQSDTVFSLNIRQWLRGARMLPEVFDLFEKAAVDTKEQDLNKAKYPYKSFPEHERVREFIQKGKRLMLFNEIVIPNLYLYEFFGQKST